MFSSRLFTLLVVTILFVTAVVAGPKKGKGGRKGGKIDGDDFKDLQDEVDELKEKIKMLEEHKDGGSHVHLFFHGDGAQPGGHSDADTVNVHVNLDGRHHGAMGHVHEAHCEFEPVDAASGINGHVHIVEEHADNHAHIHVHFIHLDDNQNDFEMHVHENGDKSDGCVSFGGHFTSSTGVSGDIGTVTPEADGSVHEWFNETSLAIVGHDGIIGRGIVIHDADGTAVACCVIGYSAEMDQAGHHGQHGHQHGAKKMPEIEHYAHAGAHEH